MIPGIRSLPFVKASACGNDFLLIDAALVVAPDRAPVTRRICDRHEGVGADGVEWMLAHERADIEIQLINADGSAAEISGNGTRCAAAYLFSELGNEQITIQTGAGPKICVLMSRSDGEYEFEMAMGAAQAGKELALKTEQGELRGIPVSTGNPHFVIFVDDFPRDWQAQAAEIQRSAYFKQGVNVEFVKVESKHGVRARFFERGAGETRSSGTGSCASAVAAICAGRAETPVQVHAPGGTQTVRREGDQLFLRGPARLLCRGEFFLT
ncbi:MAG TPA: diaminopimelate epimerase [Candidatus Sulfotelmatobacter sp.]|nr:diaminopimelate epimerase [Candidatus Sulfotelmatobacter sp.]